VALFDDSLGELVDHAAAKGSDRQKGTEEKDGVDALSSLRSPVVIFEVQPQRKLVQSERGTGAKDKGRNAFGLSRSRSSSPSKYSCPSGLESRRGD